jgi:hypothetical protein
MAGSGEIEMDVQSNAALAALVARMRLNALNGNAANGAIPGPALRRPGASGAGTNISAAGKTASAAYGARSAPAAAPRAMPAGFARLKLDLPELIEHLSNAKELYTAYSVVSRTANQMYGTMLDILEEGGIDDGEEFTEEEMGIIGETDAEAKIESMESDVAEESGDELGQVAGAGLDASG